MTDRRRLGRGPILSCMETWSQKRAEASSSTVPSNNPTVARAYNRTHSSVAASSDTPVASRTRHTSSNVMDSEHAPGRRRSSGKNSERDRDPPSRKRKERELPECSSHTRVKEREVERILGRSFANVCADDDNDNEGGASILHQNFKSACSALHGLLRIISWIILCGLLCAHSGLGFSTTRATPT